MKSCQKPLKSNPFTTYRDPKTGKWVVVNSEVDREEKKETDARKYSRCVSTATIISFEKNLEAPLDLKIVAA